MFPKAKTVTRILMLNQDCDKIAVLLRRYAADHPNWPGETVEAAARRECIEEVGVDPGRLGYFGKRHEPEENVTTHFFLALPKNEASPEGYEGNPRISDDEREKFVGDVHWVVPAEFLNFCQEQKATPGRLIGQAALMLGRHLALAKR